MALRIAGEDVGGLKIAGEVVGGMRIGAESAYRSGLSASFVLPASVWFEASTWKGFTFGHNRGLLVPVEFRNVAASQVELRFVRAFENGQLILSFSSRNSMDSDLISDWETRGETEISGLGTFALRDSENPYVQENAVSAAAYNAWARGDHRLKLSVPRL